MQCFKAHSSEIFVTKVSFSPKLQMFFPFHNFAFKRYRYFYQCIFAFYKAYVIEKSRKWFITLIYLGYPFIDKNDNKLRVNGFPCHKLVS